ncbi:MAG: PAS domain S-box protein [Candidatus Solibacter sp.]
MVIELLVLAACSRNAETLRVGYFDLYPYYTLPGSGEPSGLAPQVIREAAGRAGIRLQWVKVKDAGEALRSGEVDLIPLINWTPERQREFHMSVPWWGSTYSLVSRREQPLDKPSDAAGQSIAIRDQAISARLAAANLPGAQLVPIHAYDQMLARVCGGTVAGALLDGRLLYEQLLDQPSSCAGVKLQAVPLPQASTQLATAANRAVGAAADRLYGAVGQMELEGKIAEISNRWFAIAQQGSARVRLEKQQRRYRWILSGLALLGFVLLNAWHLRRSLGMRREAREAWERARHSEQRFETFMANSPAVAFIKDSEGHYRFANPTFAGLMGRAVEEVHGKTDQELWPAAVVEEIRGSDSAVLDSGKSVQYVHALSGADGVTHYWLVLKFRLVDAAGRCEVGGTAIDITLEHRMAEMVARNEERYRALFEEAPVSIHEIDRDGIIRRVNRTACRLLGFPAGEIVGHAAWEFVAPELREVARVSVQAKLAGRQSLTPFEGDYLASEGRVLTFEVHESPILDEAGERQGLRQFMVDLSDRKEAQARLDAFAAALAEKNQALSSALNAAQAAIHLKSKFLANMSHEIRTPMNGVLGMTELLLATGLNQEQRTLAQSVSQSGEHLLAIINDILDLSKIEADKLELERVPFDLVGVVESVVDLLAPGIAARGVELNCYQEAGVPSRLIGDPARLRQVLLNLVGNAAKFTAEGEITVRVECAGRDGGNATLRVTVADTGIGIPKAAQPHLFDAFTQADNSTTRKYGGTGLGLAIARHLIEMMAGQIGVESEPGTGSTFWFTLPLAVDPASDPTLRDQSLAGMRLLIADRNATNRKILTDYARSWQAEVESAGTPEEVLGLLRARRGEERAFDAALLEWHMKGTDGAALAVEIASDATLSETQLVVLSSVGTQPQCSRMAANLTKPLKRRALFECLRRLRDAGHRWEAPLPQIAPPPVAVAARGRVLIAEDNVVNQRVARLQVKQFGFESDVVENGTAALAALADKTYSLVLMDCHMPGMDGFEATRELRRRENGGQRVPVVALTANAYVSDREACLAAGMDDYLSKPVTLKDLGEVLARWAGRA